MINALRKQCTPHEWDVTVKQILSICALIVMTMGTGSTEGGWSIGKDTRRIRKTKRKGANMVIGKIETIIEIGKNAMQPDYGQFIITREASFLGHKKVTTCNKFDTRYLLSVIDDGEFLSSILGTHENEIKDMIEGDE